MSKIRVVLIAAFSLALVAAVIAAVYWLAVTAWAAFASLPKELAVGILAAAATVLASVLAVVAGRYFERKRELDVLHREKKIPIYDEFLKGILESFYEGHQRWNEGKRSEKTIAMLREWQRKIILWGGSDVVNAYIQWRNSLTTGEPTADAVFKTEKLFLAIRKELGHHNRGIAKGAFIGFILRNPNVFLSMASKNPKVTLTEVAEEEKKVEVKT